MKLSVRQCIFFVVIFLFTFMNAIYAHLWDFGFRVLDNGSYKSDYQILVYTLNPDTREVEYLCEIITTANPRDDGLQVNAWCDLRLKNGSIYTEMDDPLAIIDEKYIYYFVFGLKCIKVTRGDNISDYAIQYDIHNDNFQVIENTNGYVTSGLLNWTDSFSFTLQSNKDNIKMKFNGMSTFNLPLAGQNYTRKDVTFPHRVEVFPNQETNLLFRRWEINSNNNISSEEEYYLSTTYLLRSTNTVRAYYAGLYNANIATNISGGGKVYINGTTYNCPTSGVVIYDDIANTITAFNQSDYYYDYTFDHWEQNGSFYGSNSTIPLNNPSSNISVTAIFQAQPIAPAITFGTQIGQPVVINWTDHPDTNVTQYRIHRRVYQNGVWGADAVIATVNSDVESYTDYDFNLGVWQQDILLEYGITAYYSVNSTWSQGGANTRVYCTIGASMQSNDLALAKIESEIRTEFAISNYPNPFNPKTTINYQLPKDGMVTIKVYDIIGKEVATLVNEQKNAGYYKVDFDASKLTSGVYICSIQSNSFSKSIKLLLTK